MSKWGSFATGMGEGYLSAKRYKDNKKRTERNDELLQKVLTGSDSEYNDMPLDMDEDTAALVGLGKKKKAVGSGYANGGMIGEMPKHHDKMSWQRGSFKK